MLIEKFFMMQKTDSNSMDNFLIDVKEVVDLQEEVNIDLPKDIVVWATVKSLLRKYKF